MPTGYTAQLCKEEQSFEEFALDCARNFGATITMRDEPRYTPIPKFEASTYHKDALLLAEKEKARLDSLSIEEWEVAAKKDLESKRIASIAYIEKQDKVKLRLLKMKQKVEDWRPPSGDHINMREFMLSQLETTMKYDGNSEREQEALAAMPSEPDYSAWAANTRFINSKSIKYHEEQYAEELERTEERNKWVSQLKDSLGV